MESGIKLSQEDIDIVKGGYQNFWLSHTAALLYASLHLAHNLNCYSRRDENPLSIRNVNFKFAVSLTVKAFGVQLLFTYLGEIANFVEAKAEIWRRKN